MSSKSLFSARLALLASVVLTVLLYVIPFGGLISRPLRICLQLFMRWGMGIVAILVGGRFVDFTMLPNGAGLAHTELKRGAHLSMALVSMGGLIGPAFVSGLLFYLCKRDKWCKIALMVWHQFAAFVTATGQRWVCIGCRRWIWVPLNACWSKRVSQPLSVGGSVRCCATQFICI